MNNLNKNSWINGIRCFKWTLFELHNWSIVYACAFWENQTRVVPSIFCVFHQPSTNCFSISQFRSLKPNMLKFLFLRALPPATIRPRNHKFLVHVWYVYKSYLCTSCKSTLKPTKKSTMWLTNQSVGSIITQCNCINNCCMICNTNWSILWQVLTIMIVH